MGDLDGQVSLTSPIWHDIANLEDEIYYIEAGLSNEALPLLAERAYVYSGKEAGLYVGCVCYNYLQTLDVIFRAGEIGVPERVHLSRLLQQLIAIRRELPISIDRCVG